MRKLMLISTSFFVATSAFAQTPFGVNNGTVNLFPPTANSTVPFVSMPSQPNALQILQGNSNTATGAANAAMVAAPTLDPAPSSAGRSKSTAIGTVNKLIGQQQNALASTGHDHSYVFHGATPQNTTGVPSSAGGTLHTTATWPNTPQAGTAPTCSGGSCTPDIDLHGRLPAGQDTYNAIGNAASPTFQRADQPWYSIPPDRRHVFTGYHTTTFNGGQTTAKLNGDVGGNTPGLPPAGCAYSGGQCEEISVAGRISGTYQFQLHNYDRYSLTNPSATVSTEVNATGTARIASVTVGGIAIQPHTNGRYILPTQTLTTQGVKGPLIEVKMVEVPTATANGVRFGQTNDDVKRTKIAAPLPTNTSIAAIKIPQKILDRQEKLEPAPNWFQSAVGNTKAFGRGARDGASDMVEEFVLSASDLPGTARDKFSGIVSIWQNPSKFLVRTIEDIKASGQDLYQNWTIGDWEALGKTTTSVVSLPAGGTIKKIFEVIPDVPAGNSRSKHASLPDDANNNAALSAYKITAPLPEDHIFKGSANRTGGHSTATGEVRVVEITKERNEHGVYEAKVEMKDGAGIWGPKSNNNGKSTLFPDHWTKERVMAEVDDAWNMLPRRSVDPTTAVKWSATTRSGVKIEGFMKNGIITTVYPVL